MTHHHHHDHHEAERTDLSLEEKMLKLLAHWVKHNADHADSYRGWADQARQGDMPEVAALLEDAAKLTLDISGKFEDAAQSIRRNRAR